MRGHFRVSFHSGLVFIMYFGIAYSVSYVISKLGIFAYFVAYFLAFYLPTFLWILMMNPHEDRIRFTEKGIDRGILAVLILLAAQAVFFGAEWIGIKTDEGSKIIMRHALFHNFLPIFFGLEFAVLAHKIKQDTDDR